MLFELIKDHLFLSTYILINLIVDVLYGVINPRVRYE